MESTHLLLAKRFLEYGYELQAKLMEVKSSLRVVFGFWKLSWHPKNDNTLSKKR